MDTAVVVHGKTARTPDFGFLFALPTGDFGIEFPTANTTINEATRATTAKRVSHLRRRRREASRASLINSSEDSVLSGSSDGSVGVIIIASPLVLLMILSIVAVSYTHLTLPTIYSV